jgi:hypothetical protein
MDEDDEDGLEAEEREQELEQDRTRWSGWRPHPPGAPNPERVLYVPQLVFGYLYTSSNYGDDKDTTGRDKGGRNGLGAKLANMFATRFRVDCVDGIRWKRFRVEWEHNMRKRHAPEVTASSRCDVMPKRSGSGTNEISV